MAKIKVLLVDDRARVRAGLRSLLTSYDDIEVVSEAAGGEETLEKAITLTPDVVLVNAPGSGAPETIQRMRQENPHVRLLTRAGDADHKAGPLRATADMPGFVASAAPVSELVLAIRTIHHRTPNPDRSTTGVMLDRYYHRARATTGYP
jgi:DNA-binding NarL/FixJ family response regulator